MGGKEREDALKTGLGRTSKRTAVCSEGGFVYITHFVMAVIKVWLRH